MTTAFRTPLPRALRALIVLSGLLLLLGPVVGGFHHHERESGSHPCAICSLSHIPATVSVAAVGTAPAAVVQWVVVQPAFVPRAAVVATPATRGPPTV